MRSTLVPMGPGKTGSAEVVPLVQQGFSAPAYTHTAGLQLPLDFGQPGAECLDTDGLGVTFGSGRVPGHAPGPRADGNGRPSPDPLDPGQQGAAFGQQVPVREPEASSLVRVSAPAHREDDFAVSACLRTRRDSALPLASSLPSAHRAARSADASEPRCSPASRSTAASASGTRSRVRTRAPAGGATTNGSVIVRSALTRHHRRSGASLLAGRCSAARTREPSTPGSAPTGGHKAGHRTRSAPPPCPLPSRR